MRLYASIIGGTVLASLLIIGAIFVFGLFNQERIDSGQVVNKWYEPEKYSTYFAVMPISCGKNCTTYMMLPVTTYDDEDFVIVVHGCEKKNRDACRDERWELDEDWWNTVQIGDSIARESR